MDHGEVPVFGRLLRQTHYILHQPLFPPKSRKSGGLLRASPGSCNDRHFDYVVVLLLIMMRMRMRTVMMMKVVMAVVVVLVVLVVVMLMMVMLVMVK